MDIKQRFAVFSFGTNVNLDTLKIDTSYLILNVEKLMGGNDSVL